MSGLINKRMPNYFLPIMSIVLVTISYLILNKQIYDLFKQGAIKVIGHAGNRHQTGSKQVHPIRQFLKHICQ